jgi:hypothetical protein
MKPEPPQVR